MLIAIPTLGRAGRQRTWLAIPPYLQKHTKMFVQDHEYYDYQLRYGSTIVKLPEPIKDVASTRDYIIEYAGNTPVIMVDDDLDFAKRRTDDPSKFRVPTPAEIGVVFEQLFDKLDKTAHVSMSAREGANRNIEEWMINTRAMRVLGYRADIIRKHELKFGPATFMCDFHMTLALLERGYRNHVYNWMVHNQPGSNNQPGGCTEQRTPELQKAAAEWLEANHRPFVNVVQKTTKTSWGGETRYDCRVQWKAAFNSAREIRTVEILDGRAKQDTGEKGNGGAEAVE